MEARMVKRYIVTDDVFDAETDELVEFFQEHVVRASDYDAAVSKWRKIETAPIGDSIIAAVPHIRHHEMEVQHVVGEARHFDGEGWYWANNDPFATWGGPIYPTHWMPMPEPPK
jgi:hypothetical protein